MPLWGIDSTEQRDQGENPKIKEQEAVGLQHRGRTRREEVQPTWDFSWCRLVNTADGRNVQAGRKIPFHARASPHSLPPSGIRALLMLLIIPVLLGNFFLILILVRCTSPARCSIPASVTSLPVSHPCSTEIPNSFPNFSSCFLFPSLFFHNLSRLLLLLPPSSGLGFGEV